MCDTGVSHQLWTDIGECIQKNISFKGNIIEYCHWGIEFNNPPSSDGTKRLIVSIHTMLLEMVVKVGQIFNLDVKMVQHFTIALVLENV